jgi:hypothetical protein
VARRFAPALDLASPDIRVFEERIGLEIPRPAEENGCSATIVLPPETSVYAVQNAKSPQAACRLAAAEVVEGEVDQWRLGEGLYSTYACPGPVARHAILAARSAGYDCETVIAHPLALRYATFLAGNPSAAIFDWGWNESVLSIPVGNHGSFSRKLTEIGITSVIKQVSGVDQLEPVSSREGLLRRLRAPSAQAPSTQGRTLDGLRRGWEPTLRSAAQQIRQTLQYSGRFSITPPTELLVCGFGSLCEFAVEWLAEGVALPVRRWSLAGSSALDFSHARRVGPQDSSGEEYAPWAVSIAAGLMPDNLGEW